MTTEAVCERVRQIDGIDQSMMGHYGATIRKVGVASAHPGEEGHVTLKRFLWFPGQRQRPSVDAVQHR